MLRMRALLGMLAAAAVHGAAAGGFDPFGTEKALFASPAKDMIASAGIADPCRFGPPTAPLDLLEAVERALCYNPQTREAWANVKFQAAQLGVAEAAYLPRLDASLSAGHNRGSNTVTDVPQLSYDTQTRTRGGQLNLSWTLFDFGLRRANRENARQLLSAAGATQDAVLQTVFAATAQTFYDLLSAQAAFAAAQEAESSAQESFMAAQARYKAGAGALADMLQAQTTYAQAVLNRVKAGGEVENQKGTLAIAMGMDANAALALDAGQPVLPDTAFVKSVDALIEEAKLHHPSLLAARAQLQAAQASVASTTAEGRPSVSLSAIVSRNDTLGAPPAETFARNKSIGIQLNIPLFEGLGRGYRIKAANAQMALKTIDLQRTEQQISLDVWKSYQALGTETENLKATDNLQQSALQSFQVAQGRYKAGVGSMLELLSAQSTLASAKQQGIQAASNWRIARLKLAASLGKLGFWALRQ